MIVAIRYGLWIVLQIALGLLSTVVLYRVLCLMMWNFNVSNLNPNGIESWIHSPFANRQMHAIALSILSFVVGESILRIPSVVLDRNRWLVLFSLVFIFTSYDLLSSEVAHHKTDFTNWILIPYWLPTVVYLFRFQWRFIPEGTYYDLLLGPVALYGFNYGMVCMFYDDLIGPSERTEEIAHLYALYFLPTLFIYPGLFQKEIKKQAVIFSLILIGLCISVITHRELMLVLVHDRVDLISEIPLKLFFFIGVAYSILLLSSFGGRVSYYAYACTIKVWKNRKGLLKLFSTQSTNI